MAPYEVKPKNVQCNKNETWKISYQNLSSIKLSIIVPASNFTKSFSLATQLIYYNLSSTGSHDVFLTEETLTLKSYHATFGCHKKSYPLPSMASGCILNVHKTSSEGLFSANIYLFKGNNRNTRKKVGNTLKVNNENTRTTWMTSFWCFYY